MWKTAERITQALAFKAEYPRDFQRRAASEREHNPFAERRRRHRRLDGWRRPMVETVVSIMTPKAGANWHIASRAIISSLYRISTRPSVILFQGYLFMMTERSTRYSCQGKGDSFRILFTTGLGTTNPFPGPGAGESSIDIADMRLTCSGCIEECFPICTNTSLLFN